MVGGASCLLREAVPGAEPVAYLVTPNRWERDSTAAAVREGAARLGITLPPSIMIRATEFIE